MKNQSVTIARNLVFGLALLAPLLTFFSWSRQRILDQQSAQFSAQLIDENPTWFAELIQRQLITPATEPIATWRDGEGISGVILTGLVEQRPSNHSFDPIPEWHHQLTDTSKLGSGIPRRYLALLRQMEQSYEMSEPQQALRDQVLSDLLQGRELSLAATAFFIAQLPTDKVPAEFRWFFQLDPPTKQAIHIRFTQGSETHWYKLSSDSMATLDTGLDRWAPGLSARLSSHWHQYGPLLMNVAMQENPSAKQHIKLKNLLMHAGLLLLIELALISLWIAMRAYTRIVRMQKRLLASTSHELRTPLAAIRQHSELLLDRTPPDSKNHLYASHIERESRRLQNLVENLLSAARYEQLKPELRPTPLRIDKFLDELCQAMRHSFAEMDIQVSAKSFTVVWDRAAMTQVMTNLIDNARLHAGPKVSIEAVLESDQVIIRVQDSGSNADLKRLQQESPLDPSAGGLGLGLTICREIILHHGGKLEFYLKDKGLCVQICLPQSIT